MGLSAGKLHWRRDFCFQLCRDSNWTYPPAIKTRTKLENWAKYTRQRLPDPEQGVQYSGCYEEATHGPVLLRPKNEGRDPTELRRPRAGREVRQLGFMGRSQAEREGAERTPLSPAGSLAEHWSACL